MRGEIAAPADRPNPSGNRRLLIGALVLSGLLAVPILAVVVMQMGLVFSCVTQTVGEGSLPGKLEWKITKMTCRDGALPFYDVAFAAEDKTLVTGLTSRGSPVPVGVERIDETRIGVRLDSPLPDGRQLIPVRQRKSGSPVERIDLQALPRDRSGQ